MKDKMEELKAQRKAREELERMGRPESPVPAICTVRGCSCQGYVAKIPPGLRGWTDQYPVGSVCEVDTTHWGRSGWVKGMVHNVVQRSSGAYELYVQTAEPIGCNGMVASEKPERFRQAQPADWRDAYPLGSECEVDAEQWPDDGSGWMRAKVTGHNACHGLIVQSTDRRTRISSQPSHFRQIDPMRGCDCAGAIAPNGMHEPHCSSNEPKLKPLDLMSFFFPPEKPASMDPPKVPAESGYAVGDWVAYRDAIGQIMRLNRHGEGWIATLSAMAHGREEKLHVRTKDLKPAKRPT